MLWPAGELAGQGKVDWGHLAAGDSKFDKNGEYGLLEDLGIENLERAEGRVYSRVYSRVTAS